MERYSFTRLNLADSCLKRFSLQYENGLDEKLPSVYSHQRDVGRAAHSCVERYKSELQASGMDQDLSLVPQIVEEIISNDPEVSTTAIYDDVYFVFLAFAKQYRHNPKTYLGSEIVLMRELPESDVEIIGYPDHLEVQVDKVGPIVVTTDLKSGYGTSVSPEYEFQGEIMAWMMLENFEGQRVGWQVYFPRTEFRSEVVEFKPEYSQRLEARMRSIIARVNNAREEKKWPATPGSSCAYCPIASKCRERNVLVKNDVIVTNAEEAEKAAGDLVILDAAFDQRREQLKAWTKEEGPIGVGDLLIGHELKLAGIKIGDIGLMVMQLGIEESVTQGYAKTPDDPALKTEEGLNRVYALGVQTAIREGLLSVNGTKTRTKKIQEDARLRGLWVAGDASSAFGIFKPSKKVASQ